MATMHGNDEHTTKQPLFKSISIVLLIVAAILLVPLTAMQFGDDMVWTLSDFAIMGILLLGTGLAIVLAARRISKPRQRAAAVVAVGVALLLVWMELAVGLFGTPFAGS